MYLDPARRARDVLTVVFGAPPLHETHPDRAHFRELVDGLKAVVHRLAEQLRELLVVEDLQAAAGRDLAHGRRVEVVVVVAVATLYEDATVAEALGEHLTPHIVQVYTCNMATGNMLLNSPCNRLLNTVNSQQNKFLTHRVLCRDKLLPVTHVLVDTWMLTVKPILMCLMTENGTTNAHVTPVTLTFEA